LKLNYANPQRQMPLRQTEVAIDAAPIRATEGENMSVKNDGARAHWPGPREG